MKVIKKWIKSFIKKYIVDYEPVNEVDIFNENIRRWERWQEKNDDTPSIPPKRKRGRPKKKK